MEKCDYIHISDSDNNYSKAKRNKTVEWKYLLRQMLICSGTLTASFMYGLLFGAPTVFIPQIRKEANDTNIITTEMASWLSSVYTFSGFPCVIFLATLTRLIGRKIPFTIALTDILAAFVVLYYSSNITQILISGAMQGFFSASYITVSVLIMTEYVSPQYRGIILALKSTTFYWGVWISNAIGTFFHWKWIPLVGIACALYALFTTIMWPESPYWLATKGRFDECAAAHRWLKGCDEDSEKELEALINFQKEYIASCEKTEKNAISHITHLFKIIKSREFYKPTCLAFLSAILCLVAGKIVFSVYAIDIINKITNSESTAYVGMLILDGITVLSMYIGCALSRYLNRRPLLLVSSTVGIIFLFILSLYLYLIKLNIIVENKYVSISLIAAFSIAISCGPILMSGAVFGELISTRCRTLSACVTAICVMLTMAILLKLSPLLFQSFGLHGSFLSFGMFSLIIVILLYKYLPETKDRTLQEITENMLGTKPKNIKETSELLN